MPLEGSLSVFNLPEILQMIALQRKTGILTVQGEQDIIAVSFLEGEVVAADALNQTVEDGLGRVLAARGLVAADDFAAVAAEHQTGGGRLVDLLLQRRYLTREQLLGALRLQTYELLRQVLGWQDGDFKFYSNDEVSYEDGFAPISVEELLVRSLGEPRSPTPPPAEATPPPRAESTPPPRAEATPPPRALRLAEPPRSEPLVARVEAEPVAPPERLVAAEPMPAPPRAMPAAAPAAATAAAARPGPRPLRPVEPLAVPEEEPARARRPPATVAAGLAGLLGAALAWTVWARPDLMLQPFPWQAEQRERVAKVERAALYLKIDQAASTHFLLEGRYPDELRRLVDLRLLGPADLADPSGRPLGYSAGAVSYTVLPIAEGEPLTHLGTTDAITGNFLLDPEYLKVQELSQTPPLVLLD